MNDIIFTITLRNADAFLLPNGYIVYGKEKLSSLYGFCKKVINNNIVSGATMESVIVSCGNFIIFNYGIIRNELYGCGLERNKLIYQLALKKLNELREITKEKEQQEEEIEVTVITKIKINII